MDLDKQVIQIYVAVNDLLADVPTARIHEFHKEFYEFLKTAASGVPGAIADSKALSDDTKAKLNAAVAEFKTRFIKAA